jgi:hypothetical protein
MAEGYDNGGMKYIGGLWKGKTRDGQNMLSGILGKHIKIVILPNKNKQAGDKRPDVNVFIAEPEKRSGDDSSHPSDSDSAI